MDSHKQMPSPEVIALLSQGEALVKQGRTCEAVRKLRQLLMIEPEHTEAMANLALLEFRAGDKAKSIETLRHALSISPNDPTLHYRLGLVLSACYDYPAALNSVRRAAALEPNNPTVYLRLGSLHLALEDSEQALEAFQYALILQPALLTVAHDRRIPKTLRSQIQSADLMLKAKYATMVRETLDRLRQEHQSANLTRLETAFRIVQGEEEKRYYHPLQRPSLLLFPDMQARPWFEGNEFSWVPKLEAAYRDIRDELNDLIVEGVRFKPYIRGTDSISDATSYSSTDFSSLENNHIWDSFHLYKDGRVEQNIARCPKTIAILDDVPMSYARDFMPEAFFSLLRPGGHIVPHYGQMNVRLTAHLGLVVPEGCGLRVATENRCWEEGCILVFDDSFEHEAWNYGDSVRAVLVFEIWHPDLSPAEIAGLQKFFQARGEWLARVASRIHAMVETEVRK